MKLLRRTLIGLALLGPVVTLGLWFGWRAFALNHFDEMGVTAFRDEVVFEKHLPDRLVDYIKTAPYDGRRELPPAGFQIYHLQCAWRAVTDGDVFHFSAFPSLTELDLRGTKITDKGLARVARFDRLEHVHLSGLHYTAAGLTRLTELENLEWLDLGNMTVTEETFRHIGDMPKLRSLTIEDSDLPGLSTLRGGPALASLEIEDCPIGDDDLVNLHELRTLTRLDLEGTLITDEGLAHIARIPTLQHLKLADMNVTDLGIAHLSGMKLRHLNIRDTAVTDAALPMLASMDGLETVVAWDSAITADGVQALEETGSSLEILLR